MSIILVVTRFNHTRMKWIDKEWKVSNWIIIWVARIRSTIFFDKNLHKRCEVFSLDRWRKFIIRTGSRTYKIVRICGLCFFDVTSCERATFWINSKFYEAFCRFFPMDYFRRRSKSFVKIINRKNESNWHGVLQTATTVGGSRLPSIPQGRSRKPLSTFCRESSRKMSPLFSH